MLTHAERPGVGPVDTSQSPHARLKTLPFQQVSVHDGFWTKKLEVNRNRSLRYGFDMLEKAGNFDNLRLAAGLMAGTYRGYVFLDSDIYKWLEAAAWEMGREPDHELSAMADRAIELIAAAQRSDGYLNSYIQTRETYAPWIDLANGHELYCAGHLFQAAVAFARSLDDRRLLTIACRFADHIDSVFGPGKRQGTCGHPEVEMALIELFRVTRQPRYLALANFFIDQRGQNVLRGHRSYGSEYHQDHVPVRQITEAAGHAVRQLYLASGVTDLFLETGESALYEAMQRLSKDIVETKLYITGGLGARFDGEAFGDPYELPADQCYCETCAAIAGLMWNWRMLLASGDSRYADQMERALYNNILAGPALDGQHYFYINPLQLRAAQHLRLSTELISDETFIPEQRPAWHDCACCPPNVMRLFSSLSHYVATYDRTGLQIHHFASAEIECDLPIGVHIKLSLATEYPWHGSIGLRIDEAGSAPWALSLRIPGWCRHPRLAINGETVHDLRYQQGYLILEREWHAGDVIELDLEMEATLIAANPRSDAIRGCVAIQRGPIVYCLEDRDQHIAGRLLDVEIDQQQALQARWDSALLEGVMVIEAEGQFVDFTAWQGQLYQPLTSPILATLHPARLVAIPYYAWGNRGIGGMRVWIPLKSTQLDETMAHHAG